ncbi:MAG TPA: hypothetical protein VM029_14865 [Opitutaceae bacterium]|nr:hypothetical protein [Opitutaceae bacterium]
MSLIKIAAGVIVVGLLAVIVGILFRKPPAPQADRRKVVAERADTVSVQQMMTRLEAERAAAITAAVLNRYEETKTPKNQKTRGPKN